MVELHNEPRLIAGAQRYARFDQSDPWSFARALCHIHSGLCGFTPDGKDGHYDCIEHVALSPDGGDATVQYLNPVRP